MTWSNLGIAVVFLALFAAFDERNFIVPPHHVAPVRLIIFFEFGIELKVLSNTHHNVILRHAWVRLITTLIPLAFTEVESAYTESNINNSTLLSSLILNLDTGKLGILISWHKQDAALGQLLEHIARCETVFVGEVSKRLFITIHNLELIWLDLKYKLQTLCLEVKQGNIVVDTSQLPALIWVIGAARLKHGHWCKLKCSELDHTLSLVESCNISGVLMTPLILVSIPNGHFDLSGVLAHVDMLWHNKLNFYSNIGSYVG